MSLYYYAKNDVQFGPYEIEELKDKKIERTSLVWTEGMENWTEAKNVNELHSIIVAIPPPLPSKKASYNRVNIEIEDKKLPKNKFDNTYKREINLTISGIILTIILLVLRLTGVLMINNYVDEQAAYITIAVAFLILRIIIVVTVSGAAGRQNRNKTNWGIFAFFIPLLAMIIIGLMRKLKIEIKYDESLTQETNFRHLLNQAEKFEEKSRYSESIEILNKLLAIDMKYHEGLKRRAIVYYKLKEYEMSEVDFKTLLANNKYLKQAYLFLGNIEEKRSEIDRAIEYWLFAKENGSSLVDKKLDKYYNYKGEYCVEKRNIEMKIGAIDERFEVEYNICKYKRGIDEIDREIKDTKCKTRILKYENGFLIELTRFFNENFISISFNEVNDISYDEERKELIIDLFGNKKVYLDFNYKKDKLNALDILCRYIEVKINKKMTFSKDVFVDLK
ncbi:MAG: DUF4339 domain-containing protein [Bacteroidetes bacterium]|nr:DUF4339 domain-containing protein [Bacteroidota bacterium]